MSQLQQLMNQMLQLQQETLQLQRQMLQAIQVGVMEMRGTEWASCHLHRVLQALNVGNGGRGDGPGGGLGPGPDGGPGGAQPPPATGGVPRPESADSVQTAPGLFPVQRFAISESSVSLSAPRGVASFSVAGSHLEAVPEQSEEGESGAEMAEVQITGLWGDEAGPGTKIDAAVVMGRSLSGAGLKVPATLAVEGSTAGSDDASYWQHRASLCWWDRARG